MAAKKKRSRRQGWVSKALNVGGIVIGFSRIIQILIEPRSAIGKFKAIQRGLTFGLSDGMDKFDLSEGLKMYAPVGAAIGYRAFTSYLLRRFPVR